MSHPRTDNRGDRESLELPVQLRMRAEYRRCAIYALVACVPLAVVAFWVNKYVHAENAPGPVAHALLFLVLGVVLIVPLRWALRVDDRGIARRRLLGWDLWRWDDISSGAIEKRFPYLLYDPRRPWWRRKLPLEHLEFVDRSSTIELINQHYRLPPAPELPDELVIKYRFRRRLRLDAGGLSVQEGSRLAQDYRWAEVERVHITRTDPLRRDFGRLEIALPDRQIELHMEKLGYGTSFRGRGPVAEVVNEFLVRYVPAERVDVDIYGGRPAKRIDAERQLEKAVKDRRDFRWCMAICSALVVVAFVWTALAENVLKAVGTTALCAVFFLLFFWFGLRESNARCRELEEQVASFDEPR